MSSVDLQRVFKRYHRSMGGWSALRRMSELFRPTRQLPEVTSDHLRDSRFLWALRGIDLKLDKGEVVGLIGPNGSGKSSLLKVIAGITLATSGTVKATGRVGTLIEIGAGFHPEMTGRENVFLNGSILGLPRKLLEERFDDIVEFAELREFIDLPVKKYSSGMFVRLGFSVATVVPPEVLLVDEILSVGDLAFQRKSIARMRELKKSDTTILFVSHNMDAVRHFCSRGIFVRNGEVQFDGDTDQAIGHYHKHSDRSAMSFWPSDDERFVATEAKAKISSVRLLDSSSVPLTRVTPSEPCTLEVIYEGLAAIDDHQLSINIHDAEGNLVAGFDSLSDHVQLGRLEGTGTVQIHLMEGIPVARGAVRISVSVMDGDCLEPLAMEENGAALEVDADDGTTGWAHIRHTWDI